MKIRLSHSAFDSFHTCERMFQLDRLLVGAPDKQDFPATVLGKSFGAGVASYLLSQDTDKALFDAFLAYYPQLEDEKRNQDVALNLMIASFPKLDDLLMEWEVARFNNKPAVELSFRLNINSDLYYVGYVDLILKNKYTGRYAILENKTTSLQLLSLDPLYRNSGQALGYSIVLDKIVGVEQGEYDVLYFVGQLGKNPFEPKIHSITYNKTILDRLNWFISLGMDSRRLEEMLELNVFPMRGKNCLQYMRPCKHLGTCHLHTLDEYKEEVEDTIEYDFVYQLEEIVEDHLRRVTNG